MLLWLTIAVFGLAVVAAVMNHQAEKRHHQRRLDRIQKRLAEKEKSKEP
jgi:hypothetical protein